MSGEKTGLKAAVNEVAGGVAPVEPEAEQLDMLNSGDEEDAPSPLQNLPRAPGPGRPKGSINRKTMALKAYLQAKGCSDPATVLAETYSLPVDELAKFLSCDRLEAFKVQLSAAKELMPYLHGKMPQQIDLKGEGLPMLMINLGDGGPARAAKDGSMSILDACNITIDHDDESE